MKKFLIIVCVVGVVIFLGYIGKDMDLSNINGNNTNTATNSNVITAKNNTSNKDNTSNNVNKADNSSNTTNTVNSVDNTNETKNNSTNTDENNTNNQTNNNQGPAVEEVVTSDEDKAKELAKNTYGSSDGVYFKVEQVESNGVYIISVRDMETTSALAWYNVNVKTGSVK